MKTNNDRAMGQSQGRPSGAPLEIGHNAPVVLSAVPPIYTPSEASQFPARQSEDSNITSGHLRHSIAL